MVTPAIGTKALYTQLNTLLKTQTPLFIHGSPGIGKSYIIHDIARQHNLELIDVRLSQLDAVDLRGIPTIVNQKTQWMPPIFLPQDEDSKGILFLDELNSAPPSVQTAIYQLILDRKIGEYALPKGWTIMCAGNRIDDRGIVFKLPSPLINRMIHIVLEAHFEDWKEWAISHNIHPFILGFLSFRPDLLSTKLPEVHHTNPAFCTPRAWSMLSTILNANDTMQTLEPIIFGAVGYPAGIEFLSFSQTYANLPNIEAILEGKSNAVPTEPSALYALCSALLERYSKQREVVLEYSWHLPTEFAVMLIKDIIIKDAHLSEAKNFEAWLEHYGEFII